MARAAVTFVKCDRCKREELLPIGPVKEAPDFDGTLLGEKMIYHDLCRNCMETMTNCWRNMKEWDKQIINSMMPGPRPEGEKIPPLNPAPDHSPPKPHSIHASTKK